MKFLPLVWSFLWRRKVRTVFTLLSVIAAFALFGMLQGVNSAFQQTIDNSNVNRLIVANSMSIVANLPYAYLQEIEKVPGVTAVANYSWFDAYFQDPSRKITALAIDARRDAVVVPERKLPPEQLQTLLDTRAGAVVGKLLATKNGWKVGDRISLHTRNWPQSNGRWDWEFDVVGIYEVPTDRAEELVFYFNYEYLDAARAFDRGNVGWYMVQISDPARSAEITEVIDGLFANSEIETKTQSEKGYQQAFLRQVGDINLIVDYILFAVFASLLFATGSVMMQSNRERIAEHAVLKTLGFTDGGVLAIVFAEGLMLCVTAAVLGLFLAMSLFPLLGNLGVSSMPNEVVLEGLLIALALALATGAIPAVRAMRLVIVDALRA